MRTNPLEEFIDDETYEQLEKKGLLNYRAVRDYYIRKRFISLRSHRKPGEIIETLREEFPYLSLESVRKIAYSKPENPDVSSKDST